MCHNDDGSGIWNFCTLRKRYGGCLLCRRAGARVECGNKNDTAAHRAYTPKEISVWIRRYRASGLALGSFAEQHGLSRNRLHYWVYDRRYAQPRQPAAATPVFQEIKLTAGQTTPNWPAQNQFADGSGGAVQGDGNTGLD